MESVDIIQTAKQKISTISGQKGSAIKLKLDNVLSKNPGLTEMYRIYQVLKGENDSNDDNSMSTDSTNIK